MTSKQAIESREVIAVVCPHGIGNLVMALPALLTLRRRFPSAEIHLVSLLPSTTDMLRNFRVFRELYDELHEIRMPHDATMLWRGMRALGRLRRARPTTSIVLFPSARPHYNLLSFLTGARRRIGSVYPDDRSWNLSIANNVQHHVVVGAHDVEQNLMLVRLLGATPDEVTDYEAARSSFSLPKQPIIGFHTGCSAVAAYRQWPSERFAAVIGHVVQRHPRVRVRMYFGPDEREQLPFYLEQPWASAIEVVAGKTLSETVASISECSVFVSNDSGLMHLATLTGCPHVIAIVGPSDPRRTGPRGRNALVLKSDLPCMPCSHTYTIASHEFRCVRDVKNECLQRVAVDRVVEAIDGAIASLST